MSSNKRATLYSKQSDLQIDQVPIPTPGKGEILVKNKLAASNPADWKIQKSGFLIEKFPGSLGSDIVGTIEACGESVTRFKKGDRVWSWTPVYVYAGNPAYGAFSQYSLTWEVTSGKIPSNVSDEEAITLCLPLMTAMCGLYYSLGLDKPSLSHDLVGTKEYIFVNGGSTACGAVAIGLAVLSGYKVLSTASPKNFALVKSFGAEEVFDYNDPALVSKVKAYLKGSKIRYAYDADSRVENPIYISRLIEILDFAGMLTLVSHQKPEGVKFGETKVDDGQHTVRCLMNPESFAWYFSWTEQALEKRLLKTLPIVVVATGVENAQVLIDHHASGKVSGYKPVLKIA